MQKAVEQGLRILETDELITYFPGLQQAIG